MWPAKREKTIKDYTSKKHNQIPSNSAPGYVEKKVLLTFLVLTILLCNIIIIISTKNRLIDHIGMYSFIKTGRDDHHELDLSD